MNPEVQAAAAALRFHNEHCKPDVTMHPDCPYSECVPKAVRRDIVNDRRILSDAYVASAASPADAALPTARKYHVEGSDGRGWQIIDRNGDAELGTFLVASCRRRSDAFAIKAALVARDASAVAASPADDGEAELPVTEEWLRSVGFVDDGTLTLRIKYDCNGLKTELCCMMGDGLNRWSIGQRVGIHILYVEIASAETRGDVRRITAALGIPLTPSAGGEHNERNGG